MAFGFRPGQRRGMHVGSIAGVCVGTERSHEKSQRRDGTRRRRSIESARGSLNVEIETLTTMTVTADWDDDDEPLEGWPFAFDEAPLVPALKRLPKRSLTLPCGDRFGWVGMACVAVRIR
jgi:hypothetical protein